MVTGRPGALMSDLVPPRERLLVEVREGRERAGGEVRMAYVLNSSFDASLLISASHRAKPRLEVVVGRQLMEARVELDGIALSGQHCRSQVLVQQDPGHAQVLEGVHVGGQEARQGLVEEELQVQSTRVRQDHHEAREPSLGPPDPDLAEVSPVHLPLLARQHRQPQEGLACRESQSLDRPADRPDAADETAFAEHLVDPCRSQGRVPLERHLDEADVRIRQARPQVLGFVEPVRLECQTYRLGVQAHFAADRSDLPVLGEEQPADLGELVGSDHHLPPADEGAFSPTSDTPDNISAGNEQRLTAHVLFPRPARGHRAWRHEGPRSVHGLATGIPHAPSSLPPSVRPLMVAMVQPTFFAPAVPPVRLSSLPPFGLVPARRRAVPLPPLARAADVEELSATAAELRPKRFWCPLRHPSRTGRTTRL